MSDALRRESTRDIVKKNTALLRSKGFLARGMLVQRERDTCEVCGKELSPRLARVCSGGCYQEKPD